LTGNARRALISDQAINNHRVASTGQAAFVAMRQYEEGPPPPWISIGRTSSA
jgi:hypothetical protein